jgi:SAM-dependent methyltransferase
MHAIRQRRGVPGLNSVALNRAIWDAWDWNAGGEEWTPSPDWKESCVRCVLDRYLPRGSQVLEIGPGGGRWTEPLIDRAETYIGLDVSAAAVERCRKRFRDHPRAEFRLGSGRDLAGVDDHSIGAVWSFDVFVHINENTVVRYLDEFARVMKPGGVAVIHHGGVGGAAGGWRSDLTHERMRELIAQRPFDLVDCFDGWTDGGRRYDVAGYQDAVSVFRRT